jgi:hypothetical protein
LLPVTDQPVLVCIDEIQYLANPTNFLKLIVDKYSDRIQLFVTGSSSFYLDHRYIDSLAGRKKVFVLYSLTFREFLLFKGKQDLIPFVRKPLPLTHTGELMGLYDEYLRFG